MENNFGLRKTIVKFRKIYIHQKSFLFFYLEITFHRIMLLLFDAYGVQVPIRVTNLIFNFLLLS